MFLTIVGFLMVVTIVASLLTRKLSPVVAFTVIPSIAGLVVGFSPTELGGFMTEGLGTVFPTTALFIFAILYFGIMRDRGLFEPIVNGVIKRIKGRPTALALATVFLAAVAHLDGIGAATFLLTIPALLPIYDRMRMRRLVLLMLVGVSAGVMNIVPWGGPTARAAVALDLDAGEIWYPLIPVQIFGLALMALVAVIIGGVEKRRIARMDQLEDQRVMVAAGTVNSVEELPQQDRGTIHGSTVDWAGPTPLKDGMVGLRDWRYWANAALTIALLGTLLTGAIPLNLCFIIGLGLALLLNYRGGALQENPIKNHAADALSMGAVLIAVGVFLGVLNGTGMIDAITASIMALLPATAAGISHIVVGVFGVPLDLVFGADPYAFGLMPIVAQVAGSAGVESLSVAQAMLVGQNVGFSISPLAPSVYLAVGLAGVPIGQHIKFTFPWAWGVGLTMLLFAVLIGAIAF